MGRQPSEDVDSHIPARDRSVDSILQGLLIGDQVSSTRGATLNEALDRPEPSVPIQEMGYPNEETRQAHEEPQQLLSPNEQVACTYAESVKPQPQVHYGQARGIPEQGKLRHLTVTLDTPFRRPVVSLKSRVCSPKTQWSMHARVLRASHLHLFSEFIKG